MAARLADGMFQTLLNSHDGMFQALLNSQVIFIFLPFVLSPPRLQTICLSWAMCRAQKEAFRVWCRLYQELGDSPRVAAGLEI